MYERGQCPVPAVGFACCVIAHLDFEGGPLLSVISMRNDRRVCERDENYMTNIKGLMVSRLAR